VDGRPVSTEGSLRPGDVRSPCARLAKGTASCTAHTCRKANAVDGRPVGIDHVTAQVNKAIVAKAQVGPIHHPPTPASTPVATGRRQVVDHRKRPTRAVRQSDHSPQGRSRAQPPPHRLDPAHVGGITGGGAFVMSL